MKRAKDNGITLIALVITIILLLLLAGVTVNVALGGGLIQNTNKIAYQTEVSSIKQKLEEKKSAKVSLNGGREPQVYGITMNDLDISDEVRTKYGNKLVVSNSGILCYYPNVVTDTREKSWLEEINVLAYESEPVISGTPLVLLYNDGRLNIGDYVEYKPNEVISYDPDKGEGAGKYTGYTAFEQAIQQDKDLKWRVLKCDGRNVYLISDRPTTNKLTFYGHIGYLNYKEVLNNTCDALYSSSGIGQARSIELKDAKEYYTTLENPPEELHLNPYIDTPVENIYRPEQWEPVYTGLISGELIENYVLGDGGIIGLTNDSWYANKYQHISVLGEVAKDTVIAWVLGQFMGASTPDGGGTAYNFICTSKGNENSLSHFIRPIVKLESNVTDEQVPVIVP